MICCKTMEYAMSIERVKINKYDGKWYVFCEECGKSEGDPIKFCHFCGAELSE